MNAAVHAPDGTFGVLLAEAFIHHYAGWEV